MGILAVTAIAAIFSGIMYGMVTTAEPEFEVYNFTINDNEKQFVELTLNDGETIYYKFESSASMSVRVMTYEEYNDMINGGVFSYIEEDYANILEKQTEPLEAGKYVLYLKGDLDNTSGTLSYGVGMDKSDQGMMWLGMIPLSLFSGLAVWIIYGGIADYMFAKRGK